MTREVLVAGGGVGGLEAALAVRALAGDAAAVTLLSPEAAFVHRPLSVAVPFERAVLQRADLAAIAADRGFALRRERVVAVDLASQRVTTDAGEHAYDDLVLALGATAAPAVGGALTFSGPRDVGRLRGALEALAACGGGRVAFAARSMHAWTLPLYELALLTRAWADERGLDVELTVVAPEPEPLGVLGDAEAQTVRSLLARHRIAYHAAAPEGTVPGGLWVPGLGRIEADVVVALPVLTGPAVDGLPGDRLRFVPVDAFCRVAGTSTAYAVGDMAAHRIKQGGLAAQQADVAAACIAAAAGAAVEPRPYAPDLRALLLTGDDAVALRAPRAKLFGRYLTPYLTSHPALIESTP